MSQWSAVMAVRSFEDVSGGLCRYIVAEEGFVCGAGM